MQEDDAGVARAREGAQAGQTAPSVPGGHPEGRRGPLPGMKCSIQSNVADAFVFRVVRIPLFRRSELKYACGIS